MRKAFESQQRLDCCPVLNVQLNVNCRDEIIPILRALQHIYSQGKLRDSILRTIAKDVNGSSDPKRGRKGLYYWEILVLAAVRLGCELDYDALQDLAENHRTLRHIMGIGDWDEDTSFDWRRIQDNLTKIRPETLDRINDLIVDEGHRLVPEAPEAVRADSFVAETNIHYPTESSLIRDGLRKILSLCARMAVMLGFGGWRQHKHLYRKAKKLASRIDRMASRKAPDSKRRREGLYGQLLELAATILARAEELREAIATAAKVDPQMLALDAELKTFMERTRQVCDTARRRVLEGERVPNNEKLFSIFEPHTQLYKRGKVAEPVQFGRLVLVYEDDAGFVVDYHVLPRDAEDRDVVVPRTRMLQKRLRGRIRRASFDRGFHSPENQRELAAIVKHPCLPMPGVKQAAQQAGKASVEFREARRRHPGIESAIHALQAGNGLARCRDRTEEGFKRYMGLGVLGRNLHVLGKILIAREDPWCQAAQSRRAA
jgi:IS5 family transposase